MRHNFSYVVHFRLLCPEDHVATFPENDALMGSHFIAPAH